MERTRQSPVRVSQSCPSSMSIAAPRGRTKRSTNREESKMRPPFPWSGQSRESNAAIPNDRRVGGRPEWNAPPPELPQAMRDLGDGEAEFAGDLRLARVLLP